MANVRMAEMGSPSGWNDPSNNPSGDPGTAYLANNALQPLAPGTLIRGRYRVVSQVGTGGTGFVYLVHDEHFDVRPPRALKEMYLHLDDDQQQLHLVNFKREADVLETLRHPNIPRVYDSFSEFLRAYLVLDYVPGEDLKHVLDHTEGLLSPQVVGSWMIQLCTIVEYLHAHTPPIIFRDLKPSNVILTPDQRIILIDFGIAAMFSADEKQPSVGTLGYAACEQYQGEAETRSDVYAVGAMMHHLLTKSDPRFQPPFSFAERLPSRLNPAVTPELERVIMRCLEDNRAKRYQTVRDLREALEGALRLHLSDTDTDSSPLRREEAEYATPAIANVLTVGAVGTGGADSNAADIDDGSALATSAQRGRSHRGPSVRAGVLLAALVILLTAAAFAVLTPCGAFPNILAPFTSSNAFASSHTSSPPGNISPVNSSSAGSTAPQTSARTPTPGGSAMPSTSPAPSGAPTTVPTATPLPQPTATPTPAILSVSPTTITLSACLAVTQAHFTVANTGGMSLSWTAADNGSGYQISPSSGSIAAGGQETVTVSTILRSGSVTVSAPNAQHAPQQVSITCTA